MEALALKALVAGFLLPAVAVDINSLSASGFAKADLLNPLKFNQILDDASNGFPSLPFEKYSSIFLSNL